MKGKSILSIPVSSANPFTANIEKAMAATAKKVGFKFTTWENQGQSSQWVQGMDTAVNQKVDLIDLLAGTDPRVLVPQVQDPVHLEEFSIRRGSGGRVEASGGDGVVRRLRFLEPMTAVIVSSRRRVAPFGLAGGADGAAGRQWIECVDGRHIELGGTDQAELAPGEVFAIQTPGGGGFGAPSPASARPGEQGA